MAGHAQYCSAVFPEKDAWRAFADGPRAANSRGHGSTTFPKRADFGKVRGGNPSHSAQRQGWKGTSKISRVRAYNACSASCASPGGSIAALTTKAVAAAGTSDGCPGSYYPRRWIQPLHGWVRRGLGSVGAGSTVPLMPAATARSIGANEGRIGPVGSDDDARACGKR
jgi:hypothetical protein